MENKNVLIYNFGQHYREPIFRLMDRELAVDFYFGNNSDDIKTFDYSKLRGFKGILKYIRLYKVFYWQKGLLRLAFKNYSNYILLGEYFCITHWVLFFLLKIKGKKIVLWSHGWYGNESISKKIVKKLYFAFAEGYINFGVFGAIFFACILGIIMGKLDFSYEHKTYKTKSFIIVYYILLGFIVFILRGDLLSSFAYLCGFLFGISLINKILKF